MTAEEAIQEGYKCFCMQCNKAYKNTPSYWEERASCLGVEIKMCKCGGDLFMSFREFAERNKEQEILDKIKEWHNGDQYCELYEFLDMSRDEYKKFVELRKDNNVTRSDLLDLD